MNSGPRIGELVCDCRYVHQQIIEINEYDEDDVTLEDGFHCSYRACCDPVPHEWEHPSTKTQ